MHGSVTEHKSKSRKLPGEIITTSTIWVPFLLVKKLKKRWKLNVWIAREEQEGKKSTTRLNIGIDSHQATSLPSHVTQEKWQAPNPPHKSKEVTDNLILDKQEVGNLIKQQRLASIKMILALRNQKKCTYGEWNWERAWNVRRTRAATWTAAPSTPSAGAACWAPTSASCGWSS